eukprot:5156019-Pyramimonas_sp.AAC.1
MAFRWCGFHARIHAGSGAASHYLRSGAPWPAPGPTDDREVPDLGFGKCGSVRSMADVPLHGLRFRQVLQVLLPLQSCQ